MTTKLNRMKLLKWVSLLSLASFLGSCAPAVVVSPFPVVSFSASQDEVFTEALKVILTDEGVPAWRPSFNPLTCILGCDLNERKPNGGWQIEQSDRVGGIIRAKSVAKMIDPILGTDKGDELQGNLTAVFTSVGNVASVRLQLYGKAVYMQQKIISAINLKFKRI